MWYVKPKDELCHHGIKGQKWGVRRFQNPDGTLTAEGKKRYQKQFYTRMKAGTLTDEDITKTNAYKKVSSAAKRSEKLGEQYYELYYERSAKAEEIAGKKVAEGDYPDWSDFYEQAEIEYNKAFRELNNDKKLDKLANDYNKATEQYYKEIEALTKELLGKYGDNIVTLDDGFDLPASEYLKGLVNKLQVEDQPYDN